MRNGWQQLSEAVLDTTKIESKTLRLNKELLLA